MQVIHLSAECYPVAKVGGLGDVVGALPKYQRFAGVEASVVIPYYDRKFVQEHSFETVFEGSELLGNRPFQFKILREETQVLGFDLYLVYSAGLLDRPEIYSYNDETEQFVAYQLAVLNWLSQREVKPDVIHCHDHHSGLVPFLVSHSAKYKALSTIPTICTIHNGQYQGWFGWEKLSYLPQIDLSKTGLLDWGGTINPLAAAIKCCWAFTTVSPSYLKELSVNSNGLEYLFEMEKAKGYGIINGIDTEVWDPSTDPMIFTSFNSITAKIGKLGNKRKLCEEFNLDPKKPLLTFIGRLVGEKGADLLPAALRLSLEKYKKQLNVIVLGSGEPETESELKALKSEFEGYYNVFIGYNEMLAHRIYAGADFLLMPSRVEPCGLNQLYSLRYATVPVVRKTGGLIDTVIDYSESEGYGITFDQTTVEDICSAIDRSVTLFKNSKLLQLLTKRMMALDFSWDRSAELYINLYKTLNSK
ncbi:glycosyltransferase [Pedobacter sp. HMF7647]|uniref:Glycogen synthase n=1 Tax=Hufsiella arboris TaxID=2695275 RepID=A0A7K1Y560_9SPHI|nr:glycogen/starch synthase [Hufsiella arboris]MXV49723.1 glycosyltransferase [Hufsiella arboris]